MFASEAVQYLGERILNARIGLLWLLLLVGALLTSADPLVRLPWLALSSALFILAFRLWDDLADLDHDRALHPHRCLVRSAHVRSFHFAQWLLLATLVGLLLVMEGGGRALAFASLAAAFIVMYRFTARRPVLRPARVVLVLVKYPAFVLLLAQRPGEPLALLVALGIFLLLLLEEVRSTGPAILMPAVAFLGLVFLFWLCLTT